MCCYDDKYICCYGNMYMCCHDNYTCTYVAMIMSIYDVKVNNTCTYVAMVTSTYTVMATIHVHILLWYRCICYYGNIYDNIMLY